MRAPYNVLVLPYFLGKERPLFCILKRSDLNIWQFIAGGGEDDEPPLTAARRESLEEAGIPMEKEYRKLESMCYVPANSFSKEAQEAWGKYVVPVYTYCVNVDTLEIKLSHEHTEFKWCTCEEAMRSVHFDSDRTALYELNERIRCNDWSGC